MKRRTLILSALGATSALIVGWGSMPARSRLGGKELMLPKEGDVALNGWIKIAADGTVVLAMPRSEMGQGIHTALAMLVAEELDVPLSAMRLEQAGSDTIYGNVSMLVASLPFHPTETEGEHRAVKVKAAEWVVGKLARELGVNVTGGSSSVADAWEPLRLAAATARGSLLGAASLQWKLPVDELNVKDGVILHVSGKSAPYKTFAKFAALTPPGDVKLKARADWKLIGKNAQRTDIPSKVDGTAQFGMDVRLPDMVFASVRMCPMLGGGTGVIQSNAALAMPGVERLVLLPPYAGSTAGFAVVGKTSWHARQGAQAVDATWQQRPQGGLDSAVIQSKLLAAVNDPERAGFAFYTRGDAQADLTAATSEAVKSADKSTGKRVIESTYTAPYLAHATMEPMNCTAQVKAGKVTIWVPTQVPQFARMTAANVAGVALDDVTIHVTLLGGGFGRRLESDFVAQAVRVAMDCGGRPVQLVWPREEDMSHDFYRPMHVAKLSAVMDAKGEVSALLIKSGGDAISPRVMARVGFAAPIDTPDKTTNEGLFDLPYGIANQHMAHVATRMDVPIGFWRSVGHSHNAFFSESFIDELAVSAKRDPVEFRRQLLKKAPRHLAVLDLAASKANWGSVLPAGRARGVALHESFGTIVAQVAEVSLLDGIPRVHKVVCTVDCGTVVNPDTVKQQMQSSVVFALSAALYGKIDIQAGVVQQSNFPNYPVVKLAQSPVVEVYLIPSQRPPTGVGEPGVPPLAPAVANALFVLTQKRSLSLPLV
jgi:isoquinoline 1-oxidoreductase subunit beta